MDLVASTLRQTVKANLLGTLILQICRALPLMFTALPRYVGDWADDMREGKGVMTDSSGVYDGDWKSDLVRPSFLLPPFSW